MTVTYSAEVANSSRFGCFWRILCKWRGSVYKLIWRELFVYLTLYFILNLLYRYGLNPTQQRIFEKVRNYFGQQSESIPMSFVLGFYVTLICKRWWEQYRLLPWPDSLALFVSAAIPGQEERGRLMRRNIVRYAMLSYVITLHQVSFRVKKRFPTWQHMVDAGLMMESEKKIFEMMDEKTEMSKYWMPLIWATNIINRARKENMIRSDHLVQTILTELSDIRKRLGSLIGYDTVCVPLVYTQVVTLAVYTYFIAALMGTQLISPTSNDELEFYFPFFTVLQFCFYIGWLKVAEVLINPFGEDDDDIELNWLIDRHVKAAYMIVDEMHEEHPELLKDQYWDMVVPRDLPYTVASEHYRRHEPKGSAQMLKVKEADSVYANLVQPHRKNTADDVYADYESVDTPLVERRKNWFQRQLHRMGSQRSSSTTYSSGLFGRGRHNSVYSSPEAGGITVGGASGAQPVVLQHKMSLYDRLVGRSRSGRTFKGSRQGGPKMNGAVPATLRNRPRIPTPDVTKEVVDRERTLSLTPTVTATTPQTVTAGTLVAHQLSGDLPVVQVVLSPIQEMEGSPKGSQNGEGIGVGGNPGSQPTATLAQAVLSPALTSAGLTAVTTLAYTQGTGTQPILTPLTFNSVATTPQLQRIQIAPPATLTITETDDDRSRKTSVASQHSAHTHRSTGGDGHKNGEVYV